jgi:hypothetical protein
VSLTGRSSVVTDSSSGGSRRTNISSWPEESRVGGALERGVLEVLRGALEGVLPRQGQDLLVGSDEVGHPSNCGDDEGLPGGVDVCFRPWQHPHARHLIMNIYTHAW